MSAAAGQATNGAGPRLHLALLWHQHQPVYKDTAYPTQAGSYLHPWVRLHAIRDYYAMAALAAQYPGVHLTINLAPVLLWQLDDYLERGATDRALELTLKPAERLAEEEREQLLSTFFEAQWHNQIFPYPRYKELFLQRGAGRPFTAQDLRDLQMWFNLAWFAPEFRDGEVPLPGGASASVRRFIEQGAGYSIGDMAAMVAEQYKIMRAVVPIHRELQQRGQFEVSTTPFAHPILPLLIDTDQATIDRPGAGYPPRFSHPEDADAQVRLAVELYRHHFGQPPRGMWPAEGAVSQSAVQFFARHGVRWIASDQGVLARSGRWGYNTGDPDVLCRPYRAEEGDQAVSVFFRDTSLSDAIGFRYQAYDDQAQAAWDFLVEIKSRFVRPGGDGTGRVLTVALDGENAWGAYPGDGRPFLHALYTLLESEAEIETVTFDEYLRGNETRGLAPHPLAGQTKVYDLFSASWIDENGSVPGVDLGTWIGEEQENRGWALLGQARDFLVQAGATPQTVPAAFEALYMAEGSDWFWWFGEDQDSGNDAEFDDLFRTHLKNIYRGLGIPPPPELDQHIVPHATVWTFANQCPTVPPGDRLAVTANCPRELTWWVDAGAQQTTALSPAGGVMAGAQRHRLVLGPFPAAAREVRFYFRCMHPGCDGRDRCCQPDEYAVRIARA